MRPLVGRNRREAGKRSVHTLWYVCALITKFRKYLLTQLQFEGVRVCRFVNQRSWCPGALGISPIMCVLQWVEWSATCTACLRTQCERTKLTLSSLTQETIEVDSLSTKIDCSLEVESTVRAAERGMFEIPWVPRRSVSVTAGSTSVHDVVLVGGLVFDTHTEAILPMS